MAKSKALVKAEGKLKKLVKLVKEAENRVKVLIDKDAKAGIVALKKVSTKNKVTSRKGAGKKKVVSKKDTSNKKTAVKAKVAPKKKATTKKRKAKKSVKRIEMITHAYN